MVYNSYLKVTAKDGSAGIDKQSIEAFNENMSANLYKIWNRMTQIVTFHRLYERYLFPRNRVAQDRLVYQRLVTALHKV